MRFLSSIRAWLGEVARPARIASRFLRAIVVFAIACHAALFLFVLLASLVLLVWNPPVTALMVYRDVTVHQKSRPIRFVPLRQIPRVARNMIIRLEDYRFYSHHGVDLGAIRDAWMINSSIGRTAVGGSTIPMQLARNLFLTPRKTYVRKYMEALIAVEMDLILPKDRILELYLNCIEWGKGVFGIGAASAYYFKTGGGGRGASMSFAAWRPSSPIPCATTCSHSRRAPRCPSATGIFSRDSPIPRRSQPTAKAPWRRCRMHLLR
jgi:monofunctional biosynthetic peptidoglycan transglycosylase